MKSAKEIMFEKYYEELKDSVEKYKECEKLIYDRMLHDIHDIRLFTEKGRLEDRVVMAAKRYIDILEKYESEVEI